MSCNSLRASILLAYFLIIQFFCSSGLVTPENCGCEPAPPPPPPPSDQCPPPPSPSPPPPPPLNARLMTSRQVIQDLHQIIKLNPDGDPQNKTSNWDGPDPCNYTGFVCSPNPSYGFELTISDVQFNGFDLRAPLAGFLDKLVDISIFHANSNRFYGPIPSDIGTSNLPFLFELDLSNNDFDGPFPLSVLEATNLTFLDLRFNHFNGTVPPEVFTLDVDVLFINNNEFIERLPYALGSTPALYLTLANNKFMGPIPGSIGEAQDTLVEVLFLNNGLTGCLPWEIGLLKLTRVLDISKNKIHGPIPSSFGCLENMEILNLGSNLLNGVVPEVVCELPGVTNLTLSDNYFEEVGPKCRRLIEEGVLDVSMNCIRDQPDQRPPEDCRHRPLCRCPDRSSYFRCKEHNRRRQAAEVQGAGSLTYHALNP